MVTGSFIVPVVGALEAHPVLTPAAAEVERILWVPLVELTRADTFREEIWDYGGGRRPMFFFELDDETIWGATAGSCINCCEWPWASSAQSHPPSDVRAGLLGLQPAAEAHAGVERLRPRKARRFVVPRPRPAVGAHIGEEQPIHPLAG